MIRTALIAPLLLVAAARAGAQTIPQPDSATLARSAAHSALTYWEASSNGPGEQSVYLKNNSTRPIQIVSYEVYDCTNIRGSTCKVHTPGPRIDPGKTKILVTIDQLHGNAPWSYKYRFEADFSAP